MSFCIYVYILNKCIKFCSKIKKKNQSYAAKRLNSLFEFKTNDQWLIPGVLSKQKFSRKSS